MNQNPAPAAVPSLPGYVWVARATDLSDDAPYQVIVSGTPIALYRMPDGVFATEDACTHGFVPLTEGSIVGDSVVCPLHGGAFDVRTGKATKLPCTEDLRTFPVRLVGDDIFLAV
jgi:nitrite reductase/ring-hydroxylating ferredoxin subunit